MVRNGKNFEKGKGRLPPGQHEVSDFPVFTAIETPAIAKKEWRLEITGLAKKQTLSYEGLLAMPAREIEVDIHCVTRWSKLGTKWTVVALDEVFEKAEVRAEAKFLLAFCYDGYSTNVPLAEVRGGKGFLAYRYEGKDLAVDHGGPVRLFIPGLYFWKSAKWVRELRFSAKDERGFWEERGYHNHGDPWREERFRSQEK